MAIKRIVSEYAANKLLYQKLNHDLDVLPPEHSDYTRKQQELDDTKARMAARSPL